MDLLSPVSPPSHWLTRRAIDAHFRGTISPAREHTMRRHLAGCAGCRDHYEGLLRWDELRPDGAGGPSSAQARLGRGLGLAPGQPEASATTTATTATTVLARGARLRRAWPAAALALMVCLVAGLWLAREEPPLVAARGGALAPSHVFAYEVDAAHATQPLGEVMDRRSGLAFAYVNAGHRQRMMVFAVDENRRVYWYEPAWTDARTNPVAVELVTDETLHERPQAVRHAFTGQTLELFTAFGDEALSVRDVERAIAAAHRSETSELELVLPGWTVTRRLIGLAERP